MIERTRTLAALFCLTSMASISSAWAAQTPTDPNAELRKMTVATQNPLADLQRVQKINNDAAIVHFTSMIAKNPKDANAYAKRGRAYNGNKAYEKAMSDYTMALKLDPKNVDAYTGRALIYLKNKDYDKCWNDVHQAESLGGQFWPAFMDALKKGSGRDK